MYVPSAFQVTDPTVLHDFMRKHSFALLISQGGSGMVASHLPLLLDMDAGAGAGTQGRLLGHMARANPQWRTMEGEVLVIFSGPHAYISPTWYESPGTVPTWNYLAVHAYGNLRLIEEPAALHAILKRTATFYEQGMPTPWTYDTSDPNIDQMLKAIVGFTIEINRLEGKWKLSQNHPAERREKVIQALQTQLDENSEAIAKEMEVALKKGES